MCLYLLPRRVAPGRIWLKFDLFFVCILFCAYPSIYFNTEIQNLEAVTQWRAQPKLEPRCSFIYKPSPLVVDPVRKTNGRYTRAYCKQFSNCRTSFLFDDDVIVLENVYPNKKKYSTSPSYSPIKDKGQVRCKREIEFDNTATTAQLTSGCNSWHDNQRKETGASKRSVKDAATYVDRLPELEIADAYFDEHPLLDFIGNCCGMVMLAISLWYIFDCYVWFTQLVINGQ